MKQNGYIDIGVAMIKKVFFTGALIISIIILSNCMAKSKSKTNQKESNKIDSKDKNQKIAKKAGYKICFSNSTGFNKSSIDPYDIKRFGLSSVPNIMKGQLALPSVFCRKYKS